MPIAHRQPIYRQSTDNRLFEVRLENLCGYHFDKSIAFVSLRGGTDAICFGTVRNPGSRCKFEQVRPPNELLN